MRRGELAGNLILPGIAAFGACMVFTPMTIALVCLFYTLGAVAIVRAKWPLVRQGTWRGLGPSGLSSMGRRLYWAGCLLIAVGIALNLMVFALLRAIVR